MSHTKEPWKVGDVRGNVASLIRPNSSQEMLDIYPAEDARRIAACVNACAGLDTGLLENIAMTGGLVERFKLLNQTERQRDELLAMLKELVELEADGRHFIASGLPVWAKARACIAKAEASNA